MASGVTLRVGGKAKRLPRDVYAHTADYAFGVSALRVLAEQLIADTVAKQAIAPGTLTLHADRGSSMRSKPVAASLVDLEVARSHSRPYVSDDNPFSEAQFKTLKYRPEFPARFSCVEDAWTHCQQFFAWYNWEHRHSGIGFMTPEAVHYGQAKALLHQRAETLSNAFKANPKRFKGNAPQPPKLPVAAWINPPKKENDPAPTSQSSTLN
jgi:putative transposase